MVLFWLRTLTASTADCTIVKLQQPLRSTHKIEVVLVSGGGKSGGKSSQRDPVVLSWWCLWRWRPQSRAEYTMGVETKGDDEKVFRLRSMRCLTNLGLFGRERCVYMAKDANMAKRRGREMALRLILSMVVEGRVERRWGIWIGRIYKREMHLKCKGLLACLANHPVPLYLLRKISNLPTLSWWCLQWKGNHLEVLFYIIKTTLSL